MSQKPAELNVSAYMTANPISVSPDVKFFDAVTLMYKNGIGNLVVKKDDQAVGLISERQILQYLVTEGIISDKPMSHIATSFFTKISPDTTILDAAKIKFRNFNSKCSCTKVVYLFLWWFAFGSDKINAWKKNWKCHCQ